MNITRESYLANTQNFDIVDLQDVWRYYHRVRDYLVDKFKALNLARAEDFDVDVEHSIYLEDDIHASGLKIHPNIDYFDIEAVKKLAYRDTMETLQIVVESRGE